LVHETLFLTPPIDSAALPQEEEDDDGTEPSLLEALANIPVAEASPHPHRIIEDMIKDGVRERYLRCL
jgi:hypothetical protein